MTFRDLASPSGISGTAGGSQAFVGAHGDPAPWRSLWSATGAPPVATPPLSGSCRAEVAVVGAGYTGISAALHLAEMGVDVCVLETEEPGWGASGRNGGQVIPGLKHDPDELLRRFGPEQGRQLVELVGKAADTVFDVIARYGIDCDARREGWIQPAHSTAMLDTQRRRVAQWQKWGAPVDMLDRPAISTRIGTDAFMGGWIDRRAGSIHPLNYLRGLVRAASGLGARIHSHTPVTGLARGGDRWQLHTAAGPTVDAAQVLIATNGYTRKLWPGLRRSIIAANSFIVATEPLPEEIGATVLPGGEVASDSRRLLHYFCKDAEGRLLMGGRGSFSDPTSPEAWAHLERARLQLFPQTRGIDLQYRWAGRVAVTRDFLPHVHAPAQDLTIALGYNGRGIAMATTLGRQLALHMARRGTPGLPLSTIRPIPFHGLQRLYYSTAVAWYRLLDQLS
jgi:glycine/D-amino acid oxidase-like deaminating enzyme